MPDNLKTLALAATPGPWKHEVGYEVVHQDVGPITTIVDCNRAMSGHDFVDPDQRDANAAFIAACDPQTILALLAERDALREALHNTLSLAELKYGNTDDVARVCFEQARAALAKGEAG